MYAKIMKKGIQRAPQIAPKIIEKSIETRPWTPEEPREGPRTPKTSIWEACWTYFGMHFCCFLNVF